MLGLQDKNMSFQKQNKMYKQNNLKGNLVVLGSDGSVPIPSNFRGSDKYKGGNHYQDYHHYQIRIKKDEKDM